MVREVVTINVGQCGVQLGDTVWKQYCTEHNIDQEGRKKDKNKDTSFLCFYHETGSGQYVPINIMVDLDPDITDNVKTSKFYRIYHPGYILSGKEDAANNFARGHYTVGKEMIDKVNDRLRREVDNCHNVQGFVINHSVGGGTGSGLGSLILERIAVDYRKKSKVGFEIYPFNNHHQSKCVVEPYNALLATHWLLDHTEVSFIFDNRKIYNLCKKHLNIKLPSNNDLNLLISKIESTMTANLRYEGELNMDLNEFQGDSIFPFPRLHFLTPSMAPIVNNLDIKKVYVEQPNGDILVDGFVREYYANLYSNNVNVNISLLQYEPPLYKDLMNLLYLSYTDVYLLDSVCDLLAMCCDSEYFMIECEDFDVEEDKTMSRWVNCRGDFKMKEINFGIESLHKNKKICFVEWCPTGFKIGFNEYRIPSIDDDVMVSRDTVTMFSNNTFISRFFSNRISKKYDLMYAERAFVHWYVDEGMEEGEFVEAREDLGFLEKDYLDVLSEQATDQTDDDDD